MAVLAMTAGATDAISFLGLGGVFSSVMTANLVLLGLSAGYRNGPLALHAAVALTGYILGALAASRLASPAAQPAKEWPGRVTVALAAEATLLAAVTVGWEIQGGRPSGAVQAVLLAGAATGMGIQSAAVSALGVPGISTTYMTGMLTGIVGDLMTAGRPALGPRLRLLAMLVSGAAASGITFAAAPRLAPLIPLAALSCVLAIAFHARTENAGRTKARG